MSYSKKKVFSSKAKDFQTGVNKYQVNELSIASISRLFKDFVLSAKDCFGINDKDQKDINVILDSIHNFLKCVVDYAGVGSALLKLNHLRMLCYEISRAIECLQIKYDFLKSLSIPIFEILLDPELQSWIAKEILKMYDITVQLVDRSVRSSIIEEKFSYYMARLMDLIPFVDYEFQVIIVEVLFRLYTKKELQKKENIFFFKAEEQKEAFYNIDTRKFDLSTRLFLNLINDTEENVRSVLCHKVYMDKLVLHEPDQLSSFNGLWIDFNVKVKTISFYINNRDYCNQREKDDVMWEILTIFSENISSAEISIVYNEEKATKEAIGKLILSGPCLLLKTLSKKLSKARSLVLYSTNVERMKNIFNKAIPKMTQKKTKNNYVPLNRRGYEPLDIISIDGSTANLSSVINHSVNSDLVCNKWKRIKNTDGKHTSLAPSRCRSVSSGKSLDTNFEILNTKFIENALNKFDNSDKSSSVDQSIDKKTKHGSERKKENVQRKQNSKTNCYEETFMSQLIPMVPESKGEKDQQSYSYGEAFDATKDLVAQNEIKINKHRAGSGYGEKFSARLLKLEDMELENHRSTSYGEAIDAKTIKADVPPSNRTKSSLSFELKRQVTATEPDSTVLEGGTRNRNSELLLSEGATSERSGVSSSSKNLIPSEKVSKKINKKKKRKIKTTKNLGSDQNFPMNNKRKPLREKNELSLHSSHRNDEVNPLPKGEIDGPKTKNMKRVTVSVTHCSPELFSSEIEIFNSDDNSAAVNKSNFPNLRISKVGVIIPSLRNLDDSPDPIRDCARDPFDELKLEMPQRRVAFEENPNIDSTFEGPTLVKMADTELGRIASDNTGFFETARMDLDSIEMPKSELHIRKSVELFNDISQKEHSSISISDRNENIDSNSLLKNKARIKILTNIKIQSSFDEVAKSNLHARNESMKMGVPDSHRFNPISQDTRNMRSSPESIENYIGPTTSDQIEMKKKVEDSNIKIRNISNSDTCHFYDSSSEIIKQMTEDTSSNVEPSQRNTYSRNTAVELDEEIPSQVDVSVCKNPTLQRKSKRCSNRSQEKDNMQEVKNVGKSVISEKTERELLVSDNSACVLTSNVDDIQMNTLSQKTAVELDEGMPSETNVSVCETTLSQKGRLRRNRSQCETKETENMKSSSVELEELSCVKETEKQKFVSDSKIRIHSYSEINSDFKNIEDQSPVVNVVNMKKSVESLTVLKIESNQNNTHTENIKSCSKLPEEIQIDPPQSSISLKQDKLNENFIAPSTDVCMEFPIIEHSVKPPHGMPSSDYSRDFEIQVTAQQIDSREQKTEVPINEYSKKNESSEKYDLADEIEKSLSVLFGDDQTKHMNKTDDTNPTKMYVPCKKDIGRSLMFDTNNEVMSDNAGMFRKRKLYNPDDPEESLRNLAECMEISKESKIAETSSLELIPQYKSNRYMSKPESKKQYKNVSEILTRTEDRKLGEGSIINNKNLVKSKNLISIKKNELKNKERTKYSSSHRHSKNFRRLDKQFNEIRESLKSRSYCTMKSSSPKKLHNKKNDCSMARTNSDIDEKKNMIGFQYNIRRKKSLSEFQIENNSSRNNSKEGVNIEENDRDLEEFLRALGRFCGKLGSGQLKSPNPSMKKKLAALSHSLLNL